MERICKCFDELFYRIIHKFLVSICDNIWFNTNQVYIRPGFAVTGLSGKSLILTKYIYDYNTTL